ncbi:MAG: cytidine deaminase [Pedobacter sp.]|jgi:cytidine deaminase|uniref:cytidine deaminase n=1 Tax=Pedobacter sp. TaxID=1411316 RepID=UPI0035671E0C
MNTQNFTISYETFDGIEELSETDQMLCNKAKEALASSHSPYSKFKVGTAALLADNQVVLGSNQENVAYPSGLCAERVALFTIGSNYPDAIIKSMAITAQTVNFKIENPVTSCGACLQVMAEYEQRQKSPIDVLFYCIDGKIIKVKGVKSLLPFGFVEDRLGG